jgi:transcriptional regulator with XRE-family HTH domain
MKLKKGHSKSRRKDLHIEDMRYRIVADFLVQIDQMLVEKDMTHADLAERSGVTPGRISQIFNNPGNVTMDTVVALADAVGFSVSLVACDMGKKAPERGYVLAGILAECWRRMGRPTNYFDLEE